MNISKADILNIVDTINFEEIIEHPNILIAANFWEEERYYAARVCYKFMRMVDDLVDNRKSTGTIFSDAERDCFMGQVENWIHCLDNLASKDPSVKEVLKTLNKFQIPISLFKNFSQSMIFDINNTCFHTFDEFLRYSEGASVAPASVFVHLCCLEKNHRGYVLPPFSVTDVARPCALFSYLVHIIRDFQKDQQNHLNYFALDVLKKYNLSPADLRAIANGADIPASFRSLIAVYRNHAEKYRKDTLAILEDIKNEIDSRYYLSLQIIYQLYLMVFERIDPENGSFTTTELNPTPQEIKERVIRTIDESTSI